MNSTAKKNPKNRLSREAIIKALFQTYEGIYDIDAVSGAYQCYYESDSYGALTIENSGDDFFSTVQENILDVIYEEDQSYVQNMVCKNTIIPALSKNKFYSFVFRLMIDGKPIYHEVRATSEIIDDRMHILLGVRNVDDTIRNENRHRKDLETMHQKEKNYLDAILASAWGYLEVNLTKNIILENSSSIFKVSTHYKDGILPNDYELIEKWFTKNLVTSGAQKYKKISSRNYLMNCYRHGEKRASVSFSAKTGSGDILPFKEVFYLYSDVHSSDIIAFCVIYDLTEQQRKDKELRELEQQLQMSRIHNFASQMQPHFLYNALGSIQEIILDDPEYATKLIGNFTTHLRSCIRAMSNDSPIPFGDELENIKAYVNIEKMRFGEKLKINYDINVQDFLIIPLSVQPLVENAIRHGIYNRGSAGGTVTLKTRQTDDAVIIQVIDDGVGFNFEKLCREVESGKRDSTGIKNLMFRFEKVMHATVDIKSVLKKGTTVTVTIPIKEIKI